MNDQQSSDWLSGLAKGDPNALSQCFLECKPRLARIASFRLNPRLTTRIDIDDILQETYLAAAKRIEHCDCSSRETAFVWLRLILQQTLIDIHRKHIQAAGRDVQREVRADRTDPGTSGCIAGHLVAQVSSPSKEIKRVEMSDQLTHALNQMEATDREVLALRHFEELSNTEVAEVLNITIKAASIRYVRALKKLKAIMDSFSEWTFSG